MAKNCLKIFFILLNYIKMKFPLKFLYFFYIILYVFKNKNKTT